jgi:phosphoglycolate phosphatase
VTSDSEALVRVLTGTRYLLLDFDGPICSVFAGYPAAAVADELRAVATEHGAALTALAAELDGVTSPHRLLRLVARTSDAAVARAVMDALRDKELAAIATAEPTAGAEDVLRAAADTGRRVAIVSNNTSHAVERYLFTRDLMRYIDGIAARPDDLDPVHLKPDPLLVRAGLTTLQAEPAVAVLVGDTTDDIEAGQAAGVPTIGYANKPGKRERLGDAGADALTDTMSDLATALRATTQT